MRPFRTRCGELALACAVAALGCKGSVGTSEGQPAGAAGAQARGGNGGSSMPMVSDAPAQGACSNPLRDPGPAMARRLTRWEYVASMRDALGVDLSDEAGAWPQELRTDRFYNTAKDLRPSSERVALWQTLAEQASAKLGDLAAFVGRYASCRTFGDDCETSFIAKLGKRLARRPLRGDEIAAFRPIFAAVKDCGGSFDEGARGVLEALLQAPQFLYRTEQQHDGGNGMFRALDGYELAARLSYAVAGTTPDDALMAAAERGDLASPEGRAAQAKRLLATKAATTAGLRFANDWLTLDELDGASRDPKRFPLWSDALRADAKEEALRMVEDVAFTQHKPLTALLTAEATRATTPLARLYGLTDQGSGWQSYDLARLPERKGVLTTAAVLMRSGATADASMVSRALYVFRTVLCREVAGRPAGIDTSDPPTLANSSKRAASEYRIASSTCGKCHTLFEPLAFGFEPYDGIGAFQKTDEKGNATRTDGTIPEAGKAEAYANVDEYMTLLAKHADVASCFVKQPLQFALGRALDDADACTVEDLQRALAKTDGSHADLLLAWVRHPAFAFIRRE